MENEIYLSKLFYDVGKQRSELEVAYTFKTKEGNNQWSKWLKFLEAQHSDGFLEKANNRTILWNEIVLDVDRETKEEAEADAEEIIKKLKERGLEFEAYFTGSKGYHIHMFFEDLFKYEGEKLKEIKEFIIRKYNCDAQKSTTRCMIALENSPHWKTGNTKTLIYKNSDGKNHLDLFLKEFDDYKRDQRDVNRIQGLRLKVYELLADKKKREATEEVVKDLLEKEHIYTTRDDQNSEMWIYKEGIYVPQAKTYIKEFCRDICGQLYTTGFSNEVIAKIETETYIEQDKFFIVQDVYEVAVVNGVINLKTRDLSPFTPDKFFFNKLSVVYDRTKECPAVQKFLSDVLKNGEELLVFQELFGYLLLKDYKIEKAFMFTGSGRNGKGKTTMLIQNFLGIDNCANVSLQALEKDQFAKGELFNKMANLSADLSPVALRETGDFKSLTGRDLISAPRKFLNQVKFVNYAKFIFSANQLPITYDLTTAFFNRWILIDFPFTFLSQKEIDALESKNNVKLADKDIIDKISTPSELSGLLNWALIGLDRLMAQGDFSYSPSTDEVKMRWLRKSNSLNAFVMDCIEENYEGKITKEEFRQAYTSYCKEHKLTPTSDKALRSILTSMGVSEHRNSDNVRFWSGIKFNQKSESQGCQGLLDFSIYRKKININIGMKPMESLTTLDIYQQSCQPEAKNVYQLVLDYLDLYDQGPGIDILDLIESVPGCTSEHIEKLKATGDIFENRSMVVKRV